MSGHACVRCGEASDAPKPHDVYCRVSRHMPLCERQSLHGQNFCDHCGPLYRAAPDMLFLLETLVRQQRDGFSGSTAHHLAATRAREILERIAKARGDK